MRGDSPGPKRKAALFRNGRNQSVRIPREFELPGTEVLISRDGDRLVLEPVPRRCRLLEVLATMEPLGEEFPDVDYGLEPLDQPGL
ncbi:MAG: AbrB/MazE/SpoVT family DNA-binding domain-containing protein [Polyangiaceae bacterium]|nr:AbrB/MazE/SpoVT family DNA-binding domain-containing protein [Polyangiaceae bacterium]